MITTLLLSLLSTFLLPRQFSYAVESCYWRTAPDYVSTEWYCPDGDSSNGYSKSTPKQALYDQQNVVYWRKTQDLISTSGKYVGNVFVQRTGDTLHIDYRLQNDSCRISETRMDYSTDLKRLSTSSKEYRYGHSFNSRTTRDSLEINVGSVKPTTKLYIGAWARVRCNQSETNAWAGAHEMPDKPQALFITYKALANDNLPVGW